MLGRNVVGAAQFSAFVQAGFLIDKVVQVGLGHGKLTFVRSRISGVMCILRDALRRKDQRLGPF